MSATYSMSGPELQHCRISGLPSSIYYIPAFLPPSTCEKLLDAIKCTPPHMWTTLTHRRLLSLPSPLTGKSRDTLFVSSPLPTYLTDEILPLFEKLGIFDDSPHGSPNHVLVNEYLPGQGIMPHEDGPAYYPITATISLGGSTVLNIHPKSMPERENNGWKQWRILQEPGSLLITSGECYTDTLHGIAETELDEDLREGTIANWHLLADKRQFREGRNVRQTRVSLTYRDVKKVVRMGGRPKNITLGTR